MSMAGRSQVDERCAVCGGVPTRPIYVIRDARALAFDSFECAIQALAARCPHCGCTIIGHGYEREGELFCCPHCARAQAGPRRS